MKDLYTYIILDEHARQTGRTTALVKTALDIGAIYITHSLEHAQMLKKQYPTLNVSYLHSKFLIGQTKPIIFDHYALTIYFKELHKKISDLQIANNRLLQENKTLESKLDDIKRIATYY